MLPFESGGTRGPRGLSVVETTPRGLCTRRHRGKRPSIGGGGSRVGAPAAGNEDRTRGQKRTTLRLNPSGKSSKNPLLGGVGLLTTGVLRRVRRLPQASKRKPERRPGAAALHHSASPETVTHVTADGPPPRAREKSSAWTSSLSAGTHTAWLPTARAPSRRAVPRRRPTPVRRWWSRTACVPSLRRRVRHPRTRQLPGSLPGFEVDPGRHHEAVRRLPQHSPPSGQTASVPGLGRQHSASLFATRSSSRL
jgi:hypothetical protein